MSGRFGQPHAALFHAIGKRVATHLGCGVLQQVFESRAVVELENGKVVVVEPDPDCILVERPKPVPATAPPETDPGPFVATDDDLPGNLFEERPEVAE